MIVEHPALPLLVAAALVGVVPRRAGTALVLAAPVVALVQLLRLETGTVHSLSYFGFELHHLRFDDIAAPFAYVFVLATFLSGLFGSSTMRPGERAGALGAAGFGLGVVLAGDLLTLFVMWEGKAVLSALLIATGGGTRSVRSAYRYLVVHVAGGSLLLGGIAWHLATGGSLDFVRFDENPAAYVVLVAFALSVALPPLHAWLTDAYPEASVAGTVFLSIYTTKAAVYALVRGFPGFDVLVGLGVFMALYGVVYAVLENDIRRLLCYHIVSQVGFMVAGVGIGTDAALNGASAHAFAHILYKGLLLMGVGSVLYATGRSRADQLGGLARAMPAVFALYMVGAVSISSFPLFSGFVSKELIIDAAAAEGTYWVVNLLKLASVGTFLSIGLKLPWLTFGGEDRRIPVRRVPATMLAAMGAAAAANLFLGLRPGLLYDLMPFAVDYEPYTGLKLLEVTQLLTFTGLAFILLMKKLYTHATITLDTDWAYRVAPTRVAAAVSARSSITAAQNALGRRVEAARGSTLLRDASRRVASDRTPPVTTTTTLGAVAVGVFIVLLVIGLAP